MRIAVDTQTTVGKKTGFGSYVSSLVNQLSLTDHDNDYCFIRPQTEADFSMPHRFWWDQVLFPREAKRAQADVLHQPCFSVPILYSGKTVVTIHDLISIIYGHNITFWSRQFFGKWMPYSYRWADHIIAISQHTKKDIIRLLRLPEEKITVIYEGVDERYHPKKSGSELTKFRERFKLTDCQVILHVGTLEPRKNLQFLIRAFAESRSRLKNPAKLVITGKRGWFYQPLFELVDELKLNDEVVFTDYVPDEELPTLYNAANVFAFPSLYEGFGLPPLEAMACGVPVLSSNSSSMPEIVGSGGILMPPTDAKAWTETLVSVLNSPSQQQELSERGINQAKKFTWKECAEATRAVYEQTGR
ncbi:MAG: glycosyltransferase family 4 protein [Candidatus Berkelbacteria bacterium]|nr:MAG: glycosyltransferase family 4 protein [Candidatus Berkelbacteria bacterium]QQG51690.1 MAG: glycosyltransferase family 4 protein [Candidatus Berkelbacteria bacterium]